MSPLPPRRPRPSTLLPGDETLVAQILEFLGDDPARFESFLHSSGLALSDLRAASAAPGFAEGLLDHLCADEALLVAFAAARGYDAVAIEWRRCSLGRQFEED